jgi:DNA polymerase I-like protein with 3'-5' exonuclease and polymerase domains
MHTPSFPFSTPESDLWTPPELPDLSRYTKLTVDCETDGLDWQKGSLPVGIAVTAPEARGTEAISRWYIPWGHRGGGNIDEARVKEWARRELRFKQIRNLNTRFDLHFLRAWGVDLRDGNNTFRDVSHSEALLDDHTRKFSLEAIAQKRLGEGKLDVGVAKDSIAELPAGMVAGYAIQDCELVDRLVDIYEPLLAAESLNRVQALEDAIIPVVVEMESNGLPLDMELLTRWEAQTKVLAEKLAWELYRLLGFTVNPDSSKDLHRLFEHCGVENYKRTETGQPSFTGDVMKDAASKHEAIKLAYRIGKINDLRSKSLLKYLKDQHNGVLYPSFYQLMSDEHGTVSGRFSSARPNAQNVQGKDKHLTTYSWLMEYGTDDYLVRRLFKPQRGTWVCSDMAQIEMRLFVHYSNSERLLAWYRENPKVSFHKKVFNDIIQPVNPDLTHTQVKVFGFTGLYGGGAGAAARVLGVDDARGPFEAFHEAFPEMRALSHEAQRVAESRGYVKSILGRRSRFVGKPGQRERTHKALNCVIQPTAADLNKLALVELYNERENLGLTMRATVHDEMDGDLEGPVEALEAVLERQLLPLKVPVVWETGTGPTWADAKD